MEDRFLIKNCEGPTTNYLRKLTIERHPSLQTHFWGLSWDRKKYAIQFTSQEEAQATIDFIINVIDCEKEGYLEIEKVQG